MRLKTILKTLRKLKKKKKMNIPMKQLEYFL